MSVNIIWVSSSNRSDSGTHQLVKRLKSFGYEICAIQKEEDLQSLSENKDFKIALIELRSDQKNEGLSSFSSAIKQKFPAIHSMAVFNGKLQYENELVYGESDIDEVFQYPMEDELIINSFFEFSPIELSSKNLSIDILARVNVFDIKAGESLPFDLFVYLPANEKIIPYNHKNQALDEEVIEKFKANSHYSLYLRKSDLPVYYEYCAKSLANSLSKDKSIKERELTFKLKGLLKGFFDNQKVGAEDASLLLENLGKVIAHLEETDPQKNKLVKEVNKIASRQLSSYGHAKNMATYCAMFGMVAGLDDIQSLRMGGLLHDLGMMDLPANLLSKDEEHMNSMELSQYKLHPGNAKMGIMEKGILLPKNLEAMIMQHHERSDGSGFPYGMKGSEISPYAKICAFADVFDTLTSVRESYVQMSPRQAMEFISGRSGNKAHSVYEEALHKKIVDAFLIEEAEVSPTSKVSEKERSAKSDVRNKDFGAIQMEKKLNTDEELEQALNKIVGEEKKRA